MNLLASMTRPLLPAHVRSVYQVGARFDGRLDELYLTPNKEEANQRFLTRVQAALTRRYRFQATFSFAPKDDDAAAVQAEILREIYDENIENADTYVNE